MPDREDPEVIRLLREYRLALIGRENEQIKRLAKEWLALEYSLKDEMTLLAIQINEEKLKGSVITEQLMRRMSRYQKLNEQMKTQILRFVKDFAISDIEAEQLQFGLMGIQSASEAIKLTGALGVAFDRLPADAVETYVGMLGDGTPLYRLLKEAYPQSLDGVVKSLLEGTAKGLNPNQVAYQMSKAMGMGLERITLIARTEQLRVNRLVSAQQYRQSGLEGVMKRVATKDNNVCMACLVSDGEIIELDQELDDHPRGRCVAIFQINGSPLVQWENGKDWFERQDEETQRSMMGNDKWEAWQAGKFDLSQLRETSHSDVWGDSPRTASLSELLEGVKDYQIDSFDKLTTNFSERFGTDNVNVEIGSPDGHSIDVLANARGENIQVNMDRLNSFDFSSEDNTSAATDVYEIVIHEYGHIIERQLLLDDKYFDYGLARPSITNAHGIEWDKTLAARLDSIARREGIKISEYATTNAEEYFAEAFILYNRGEDWHGRINPEVLEIFKRLDKDNG